MMKIRLIMTLVGLCLVTSAVTAANENRTDDLFDLGLNELMQLEVEIATGTKKAMSKAPAAVTVITSEDIKKTGATNVVEVLESVPGVHVRYNRMAYSPFIHIRGTNTNQVLLMVNGVSMRSLTSSWPQDLFWKGLPASAVERVEVIRGPGSALYGSNANAGVVNIITKTAGTIDSDEIVARLGSFNTQTVSMQHGTVWNEFDIGMTAEISHTEGHDPFIQADKSGESGTAPLGWKNLDLRMYMAKGDWRLQGDYTRHSDLEIGFVGSGYFDPVTKANDERFNLAWLYKNESFSPEWGVNAEVLYQDLSYSSGDGFREVPPGSEGWVSVGEISQQRAAERHIKVELSGLYSGVEDHAVRLGAGFNWQDLYHVQHLKNDQLDESTQDNITGTAAAFAAEKIRRVPYLFVQDVWVLSDQLELTVGARYDNYSDVGYTINPRLAAVVNLTEKLTTKFMYGEGYRAPSFAEVAANAGTGTSLNPENSKTHEIGVTYQASDKLITSLNIFQYEMSGIIKRSGVNGDDFGIKGVELEVQWQISDDLRLSGNYTVRKPDEVASRKDYEPYKDAYLRMDWGFRPQWNWNIQADWIADRRRKEGDARENMANNLITDTTLRYTGGTNWEFSASIHNLFNQDVREHTGGTIPNDLPLPDRNFFVEARYKF